METLAWRRDNLLVEDMLANNAINCRTVLMETVYWFDNIMSGKLCLVRETVLIYGEKCEWWTAGLSRLSYSVLIFGEKLWVNTLICLENSLDGRCYLSCRGEILLQENLLENSVNCGAFFILISRRFG